MGGKKSLKTFHQKINLSVLATFTRLVRLPVMILCCCNLTLLLGAALLVCLSAGSACLADLERARN